LTWPIFAANPKAPQAPAWQPGQPLKLGSLGRLHTAKGYDVLIAALALLRERGFESPVRFSITIGGEGHQRQRLEEQSRAAGVQNLLLPGFVNDPQAFLAGLHLYLQPSRAEGFCIAAHEAMVAGLPVLTSAVGELAHSVVDELTGRLFPPDDPLALANALQDLLSQPEALRQMGIESRARVLERFSHDRFKAAGMDLFTRMVAAAA
jgi:glycosyltransferase involved in cell wall biosynthesis